MYYPADRAYVTAKEVRAHINMDSGTDDTQINTWIAAACQFVDSYCNRPEGFVADDTASAKEFSGNGKRYLYIPEAVAITEVAVKTSVTDTAYTALEAGTWLGFRGDPTARTGPEYNSTPHDGILLMPSASVQTFLRGDYRGTKGFQDDVVEYAAANLPTVRVTARWGYAETVPPLVVTAVMAIVTRWYKQARQGFADTSVDSTLGEKRYTKKIPPEVEAMLGMSGLVRPSILGH